MHIDKATLDEFRRLNVAALDPRTDGADRAACHERIAREVVPSLLAERMEMLAVLREIEWNAWRIERHPEVCPCCGSYRDVGHAYDCRLAALLR